MRKDILHAAEKSLFILAFSFLSFPLKALEIDESTILKVAQSGSPQQKSIQSNELLNRFQLLKNKEIYATELYLDGQYIKSKEQSLIPMNPLFSPIAEARIGLRKNHELGLSSDISVASNIKSSTSGQTKYNDLSSTTLQYTLKMDLWKDFLGRISKTTLKNLDEDNQKNKIQADIAIKNFEVGLRRIYWSLVANNESLKISQELLKSANSLLSESKRRYANSIAEKDEMARYEALVAQRQGSILLLEYQRENLIQSLKSALPGLGETITLGQYDINKTISEVLQCTSIISNQTKTPRDFTKYDELTSLLKSIQDNQRNLTARYDSPDIKLFGTIKSTGTSSELVSTNNYQGSLSDSYNDLGTKRAGFALGLNVSIPIGDEKNQSKSVKEEYDRLFLLSEIEKIESSIETTHAQLVKSIQILNQVLSVQKTNSDQLKIRIAGIRKKYTQARATADDIINDQDSLLASELTAIDTRLKILNTIFDYFSVFTETNCAFNRI